MTSTPRLNYFLISIVVVTAITLIVFAAITAGSLLSLVVGVVVLGLISIGLASVGVNLFARWSEAQFKRDDLKLSFIEHMADKGILVEGRGVPNFRTLQLPEPESDIPVGTSGVTNSTVAQYKQEAIELSAVSKMVMPGKDKGNQIATYRKAKAFPDSDYFRGGQGFERWQHGCQYLLITQLAYEDKDGGKVKGRYVKSGTLGQLYEQIKAQ